MTEKRHKRKRIFILVNICLCVFLIGCDEVKVTDLVQYVNALKTQKVLPIKPRQLPEFSTNIVKYQGNANRQDPFSSFVKNMPNFIKPDLKRSKQPLEAYSLSTLEMRGSVNVDGKYWAIVKTPDNLIYRVKKGDYIGKQYGKIEKVDANSIKINEIVSEQGQWHDQYAFLTLSEEE